MSLAARLAVPPSIVAPFTAVRISLRVNRLPD